MGDFLHDNMVNTTELTPWHREHNVGVHTNMVVAQYLSIAPDDWTLNTLCGAYACAFHDVGKPAAKEMKFSEARGHYPAFKGHEQISARLWEDYAVQHRADLQIPFEMIFTVGWMIEHHLPYEIKKPDKRLALALTATVVGLDTFTNVLFADAFGRISDDMDTKTSRVHDWVAEFSTFVKENAHPQKLGTLTPTMIVPIGVSGAGKSTLRHERYSNYEVFSLDDLRHQLYDTTNYTKAYEMSVEDKEFSNKAHKAFMDVIKTNKNVFIDNTNLSRKRRRMYIDEARKRGYTVVAILLPINKQLAADRQGTRTDKSVPVSAVHQQYMALQYPSYGEFDDIRVYKSF